MATKVNLMKLLQEARGLAQITNRRPSTRTAEPALLPVRSAASRAPKPKRTLRIVMQNPPDIPHPVKITHRPCQPAPAAMATAL